MGHLKECLCEKDSKTRTVSFLPELKKIIKLKSKEQCNHLKHSSDCLINYIADVSSALLRTDIKLKPKQYKKLKKHKKTLLALAKKKSTKSKRKELLKKRGGFLPALIPPLLGVLGSVVADMLIS